VPSPGSDRRLDAVFDAIADPTRREVVERLAVEPASASALARQLPVSRQAVAKHLDALERAGLVEPQPAGREVRFRLTPAPLVNVAEWAARVGAEWDRRLDELDRHLKRRRG
jgi:DNA-binding transcriptional ArsR family regulator